jgi:hypothetical protein
MALLAELGEVESFKGSDPKPLLVAQIFCALFHLPSPPHPLSVRQEWGIEAGPKFSSSMDGAVLRFDRGRALRARPGG